MKNIPADTLLSLSWKNADRSQTPGNRKSINSFFRYQFLIRVLLYQHHENIFNDFSVQRLLPHKYSQLGPFITIR